MAAPAAPPEPGSARRLLELLEVARASPQRAEKAIAAWASRIEAGTEAYKAPSEAARIKVDNAKSTARGLPVALLKAIALKLSAAAALDEEQAVQVAEAFLFENPVRDLDAAAEGTLLDLLDFHLDERLALVSLPAALARLAADERHTYRAAAAAALDPLIERGLEQRLRDRCRAAAARVLAPAPAPRAVASRLLSGALGEVCAYLEALFALSYVRLAPSHARLHAALDLAADLEYGRRLSLALSASAANTPAATSLAARVPALCCLLVLCLLSLDELRDLSATHFLAADAAATARLHRHLAGPAAAALDAQAPVRLAWGAVCSFAAQTGLVAAELANGAADLVARDYHRGLEQVAAGLALVEPHSAHPLALRATADSLLALLLTTFPSLPHTPDLLRLHAAIYTDAAPLVARFWAQDAADAMRGALLHHAVAVFPCQPEPLLLLLRPLVADADSARAAHARVAALPSLCAWLDDVRAFAEDAGDGQVRATQSFHLWGALVPAGTLGTLRANTVVWRLPAPVDGWPILAQHLAAFVAALSAAPAAPASLPLAALLLSLLQRLVAADASLAPLLDAAFAQPAAADVPALLCLLIGRAPQFAAPSEHALDLFAAAFALLHLYADAPRPAPLPLARFVAAALADAGLGGADGVLRVLDEEGIADVPDLADALAQPPRWAALAARLGPAAAFLVPALAPRARLARLLARHAATLIAALRSLLPAQEAPAGKYPITQAAIGLLAGQVEWRAESGAAGGAEAEAEAEAEAGRWAEWAQGDVLTGFEAWRYTHAEDKWQLASALFALLSALLRLPSRTALALRPALAADPSLHHVLLAFAAVGHRRLERLHLARQPRAAAALEAAVERALALLASLMDAAPPPTLLAALLSRRSGPEPLVLTLALYVLYLYSAAVPVRALRLLTLVAASAGRGSRAGSLVGFLGPHAESIAVEFARRVADRATPPALRSALLLFLAAAFDTQPGLVPHLLRQADGGAVPLLRALHRLLDDERADAALRRQALAALEAIYSASPELLASLRASDAFWRSLLRVLTAPAARPSPDDWHVRAHVLRLLALEAHAAPAPDSPVAKALDAPLSETLKAAGLPDALEAVLSKATEGALAALRDDAVPHAERLARLAAAARLSALPRLAAQGDADAFVYDAAALSAHPELARATRAWNVMLCRAAALDALAAAALRLVVAAAARKFAPLTSRVAPAVAARLLAWLAHLFDGALAPEGERAQYPLLPLGLPVFCPVFAALVARITLSLVQLLLHLLNSLRAPPAGVALPSPTRLALLAALLLQRALRASAPSVPLLRAVQALLLLALRTDAARDEALRGGVLEALLAAQVRLLALGPELVPSVYAVLARLHHAASTPHFAAAGLYERLAALLVPALAAADAAPAQALLQLLVALAAEPSAAEALVAHGALFALAKPSAADDALWPAHVALVVRLLAALRAVESGRDGLQQWLELLRPALLRSLAPPSPRAPAPLASLNVAERVALLLRHLVLASRQWRSAAHLAPTEAEVLALLALLSALTSLAFQPQLLERAFVSEGGDGFPVRAEEAVLGAVRAVLQTLLAVCAAQPALVLLLPYVSSTPPAHLSDSPLPTMGAFADWIVALADLLLPADAPDAPAPPRSASHKALILRVADLCVALCLHHARLFLTEPAHEPLRRRFRSEVVAELDGHVARLVQGLRAKRVALDTDLMVRAQEALAAMRRDPGSGPGAAAADAPRAALLV